ncbi:MAG: RNA polymerase sigma factor, partial [Paeniclostridium sordellii]|nr:RNA polymerase sigma factor [Paeniclostridium sordellii]
MNRDYEKISELVNKVKEGDLQAFDELYSLTYNKVYLLALSILKNKVMAEDSAQIISLKSLKSVNQLKNPKTFIAWINKITYNYCLQEISKLKREKNTEYKEDFMMNSKSYEYQDPLEFFLLKESQKEILYLISKLSEKQSTILVLKYFEGLKISEIAYVLDIPEGTVKTRLHKAK